MKKAIIIGVISAFVFSWVAKHIYLAEETKNNPPIACYISGGSWDIWNGWSCK